MYITNSTLACTARWAPRPEPLAIAKGLFVEGHLGGGSGKAKTTRDDPLMAPGQAQLTTSASYLACVEKGVTSAQCAWAIAAGSSANSGLPA